MDKKFWVITLLLVVSTLVSANNTTIEAAQTRICGILERFYDLFLYLAGGIGALMIVFLGVTWIASADNSKARTAAKSGIIHVIIGLLIISVATALVMLALPEGSDCITTWT